MFHETELREVLPISKVIGLVQQELSAVSAPRVDSLLSAGLQSRDLQNIKHRYLEYVEAAHTKLDQQ